jgi:phosphatidylserine/phosphatidylglycerophosphate/cardiolipin synthase-like enzyme
VAELAELGIEIAVDASPAHMHHKFAIFDRRIVVTGSFNWTRSATTENNENIVVIEDPAVVQRFSDEFERLWKAFRRG